MRPMFVLFSAGMHGKITPVAHRAATLIELLHTATLVHDDVVDDAYKRRGLFSLNAIWKNKISVLVGDYFLSRGLLIALENRDYTLLHIVAKATKEMSEGELLQIEKARRLDIEEDIYFEIIRKKTASLIAACCASGAIAAGADDETVKKMHLFGEKTGIAFQIKDDLFDYQKENSTGKPSFSDLKENKLTLPVIYMLNKVQPKDRAKAIRNIKYHNRDKKSISEVKEMVISSGGFDYAERQMHKYKDEAISIISTFSENSYTNALKNLVIYTTERIK